MHAAGLLSVFVALLSVASASPASPEALERRVTHTGTATFFFQNGVAGTCGKCTKTPTTLSRFYDNGVFCGRTLTNSDTATGKTAVGTVADECPTSGKLPTAPIFSIAALILQIASYLL
ncbi:hypothetical protein M422DRAFT_248204 [Sphaerobolus stellatus SS14]|uniref:Uncharacterized protein n=1 Tax=Sphaerobolus stellatus (strain SS14) TaxID=990650 RepID=A0A0C9VWA7_SPHS4|nr:hypothetical protein M422DRAFT_248204 [Sphaerobolus stellatus SS14]